MGGSGPSQGWAPEGDQDRAGATLFQQPQGCCWSHLGAQEATRATLCPPGTA